MIVNAADLALLFTSACKEPRHYPFKMPGRRAAGWERSRAAVWHGTGPEDQDTAIHPLDLTSPSPYPSMKRMKRTQTCQLLEVTSLLLPPPLSSHSAGATGQVWAAKRHRLRATQSYFHRPVRLGHAHHLAYLSSPLPQGDISPGGRPCWCQATQWRSRTPGF